MNEELFSQAEEVVYKESPLQDLSLYIFGKKEEGVKKPCLLFFYSSFWEAPAIGQFAPHATLLASLGMIAVVVEYRTSKGNVFYNPSDSMADACSAIRWVRLNADEIGIDPEKVVGAGGSGGASLAVCSAMIPNLDDPTEDVSVSSRPNGLVLFNPVLDFSKKSMVHKLFADPKVAKTLDPIRNIKPNAPPILIIHGGGDAMVPIRDSEVFTKRMQRKGNACDLLVYEGQGHSFYNFNVSMEMYDSTMSEVETFLLEQEILEGEKAL